MTPKDDKELPQLPKDEAEPVLAVGEVNSKADEAIRTEKSTVPEAATTSKLEEEDGVIVDKTALEADSEIHHDEVVKKEILDEPEGTSLLATADKAVDEKGAAKQDTKYTIIDSKHTTTDTKTLPSLPLDMPTPSLHMDESPLDMAIPAPSDKAAGDLGIIPEDITATPVAEHTKDQSVDNDEEDVQPPPPPPPKTRVLSAEHITLEAFAPFGRVIKAFGQDEDKPEYVKITPANQGTATKFSWLGSVTNHTTEVPMSPTKQKSSWFSLRGGGDKATPLAKPNLCVYRCETAEIVTILPHSREPSSTTSSPVHQVRSSIIVDSSKPTLLHQGVRLRCLERHPLSSQTFIPMIKRAPTITQAEGLAGATSAYTYLVVVASSLEVKEGSPPDWNSLTAFLVDSTMGIEYSAGVWHHPMIVLGEPGTHIDMACLVHETGDAQLDCEETDMESDVVVSIEA